ncbi:hypothetical protein pipiens_008062 [Culex pipiens pipiens]|uniref:Uncharacterized protein n=1 Tax=Culex pipiens pipiens TaxID=38569 RepID=A0ABD1DJ00_CULPP
MFCCSTTKRLEICTPEATIQVCFPLIRVAIRSANPPPYDNRPKPVIRLPICVDIRRSTCLAPNWADNLVIFYRGVRICVDKFCEARHDQPLRADLREQQRSSGDLLVNKIRLLVNKIWLLIRAIRLLINKIRLLVNKIRLLIRAVLLTGPKPNIRLLVRADFLTGRADLRRQGDTLLVRADLLTGRADLRRQGDPARRRKEFSAILSSVAINALGISNEPKMSPVDDLPRTVPVRWTPEGIFCDFIIRGHQCIGDLERAQDVAGGRSGRTGMELAIIVLSVRSGDEE